MHYYMCGYAVNTESKIDRRNPLTRALLVNLRLAYL